MKNTGVFATEEEIAELKKLAERARTTPVILMGGVNLASSAWESAAKRCHEMAMAHGLPDHKGYYGMTADGEFCRNDEEVH